MSGYMFLKIAIIFNIIIIAMTLISYVLVLKNNKKYLSSIIKLAITFVMQTVLIIGLNSKGFSLHVTIVAEVVYLIYFIYQANKIHKMYLAKEKNSKDSPL
ncbi:hypothetical protein VT91_09710 [Clostridium sporogenes]|uniref:hypothetical protein n=1 Tax=Clostridium botulinum TaxID=1491 RepID=UPI0007177786|nr:hypothetical protein [Clostridium botulinum]KRU29357.1 hypothetical protein WG71_16000 [Clostridium sporogenes]KRU33445.1 hypothetical protein VT91_09710 [Clostridium sporogenes]KRU33923.1 hypothetical protein VT28_04790 [Clostridium sporogenes]KRU43429.1 hypothetical protein VT95_16940 [Clostridium sporogenes]MBZ1330984.1 hypothetical protein [Clostridium botulinum]